jgi:ribonuclease Z
MNWWREAPPIYGPPGTAELVAGLETAFAYDLRVRRALDRRDHPWVTPTITVVNDDWRLETPDVRLSAFRVDHHPVDEAFGFRLDAEAGSMAFSGDTRPVSTLVDACQAVDVLVHEVYAGRMAGEHEAERLPASRRRQGVASYHTSSYELGQIALDVDTRHLVLNHMLLWGASAEEVTADVAATYSGELTAGEDLVTVSV